MQNRKTWKSVGALLLTVAMLAGMLSVMGALPATAKTTTAMKFTADFSELSRIVTDNGGTFTDGVYRAPFTPASDTASLDGKFNTWANEKFYTYQTYSGGVRAYLGQDSNNLQRQPVSRRRRGWLSAVLYAAYGRPDAEKGHHHVPAA